MDRDAPDYEDALRRLTVNDQRYVRSVLADPSGFAPDGPLDSVSEHLVRLGALIALDAGTAAIHAEVAEALAAVLDRAPPGTYHAANSGWCSWYEFARAVLGESGLGDVAIEPITADVLGRPAPRPANSRFTCDRLEAATGLRLRPWQDALRAYLGASDVPGENA